MFKLRRTSLIIAVTLLLAIYYAFSLSATEAKISPELQASKISGEEEVEVLIYMRQQVDTARVAMEAGTGLSRSADSEYLKTRVRESIVTNLQKTTQQSQAPLLGYLSNKHEEGLVSEIESYYIVNMIYSSLSPQLLEQIAARPDVDYIYPNTTLEIIKPEPAHTPRILETGEISWNIELIKAPEVWSEYAVDGSGVVVGVIDTGVNLAHPALEHNWRGYNQGNYDASYNWFDPFYNRAVPDDQDGHGTKVTGLVTGSEEENAKISGVAPGAEWIAARGFDDQGKSSMNKLLAAGEYMLAPTDANGENPDPEKAPDIVVNAWGGKLGENDWYKDILENWRNASIFPVFAAGNDGPADNTINNPANYPESFAVGAVSDDKKLANFSSRGPGAYGDMIKPELVAPGVGVHTTVMNGYGEESGTSFAAPHVAGTAALMLSANPQASVIEIEKALKQSATPLTDQDYPDVPNYGYGYGLVNAMAAVEAINKQYTLSVHLEGRGFIEPEPGEYKYNKGEEVTLTAEPFPGWEFVEWSVNDQPVPDSNTTLTMNSDKTATAYFAQMEVLDGWLILPTPDYDMPLKDSWLISLNRSFSDNEVVTVEIKQEGDSISARIGYYPEKAQVIIKPKEPYQPGTIYELEIILCNSNQYKMYFITDDEY